MRRRREIEEMNKERRRRRERKRERVCVLGQLFTRGSFSLKYSGFLPVDNFKSALSLLFTHHFVSLEH